MKKIGVGILGLGTVGGGTYEILKNNKERIKNVYGLDVDVYGILDKSIERLDYFNVPKEIRATDIMEIVSNPNIDIVCELIGGTGVAKDFVKIALSNGKTVVTANKEMIAKHFVELNKLANNYHVGLYYEASCVGGTPVIRTITDSMQANNITQIMGIVNGTTNYILSKMADEGMSYEKALKEAQKLGFAELDPKNDVEGYDSTYKLAILSSLAFNGFVDVNKIFRVGIQNIKVEDIEYGKALGYTLKLLAIGKNEKGKIEGRVHPTFIKNHSPLASIKGAYNALKIVGDSVGDIMLYGAGAGALPTGSAIVSDIIFAANKLDNSNHFLATQTKAWAKNKYKIATDFESFYYIRLKVEDKAGVLAKIGTVLANNGVSLSEVIQKGYDEKGFVPLIITTHKTLESSIQSALKIMKNTNIGVESIEAVIRIEK